VGAHNLARLTESAFERHGDYEAMFFEGKWHNSADLFERGRRVAGGLTELGIQPGDRVVVMMANCPEVGILYHALWRIGAVITPAIFLLPPEELRHVLTLSEAVAIVTSPELIATVDAAVEGAPSVRSVIVAGEVPEGKIDFATLEDAEPHDIVDRDDGELAALLFTGGTTGRSKGVMLSHSNLWEAGKGGHEASYVPGVNRTIVPLPLAHSFGILVAVAGGHAEEPSVSALQRWFDPGSLLEMIQELQMQRTTVVPTMLQMLLALPLEDHDLSSLVQVISGAAPLPVDLAKEFERRVPSAQILEGYGLSETGGAMTVNRPGDRTLGSVGRPYSNSEVRLVDDDGKPVGKDEEGEVTCRAPFVMQGYWRDDEATANTIRDGWLFTGDVGRFDDDGNLYIVDRKKDLIIRGGFNVYPRDVEEVLLQHPAVARAGVVGKPDPSKGEEVVGFVQLNEGAEVTPEELIAFAKERLGGYKYPREVRIIDAVPLTPVLKIDRKQLRAQLLDEAG
jgi:long-chain acyl-CoA synthetase